MTKKISKKPLLIKLIIIFIILSFIIIFLKNNNKKIIKLEKENNKIFITKKDYLKNPLEIKEKILKNNSKKLIKIISKKNLKIYKNYGFFQVETENIKIDNQIANWFFITNNWLILTNKHILEDEKNLEYVWINSDKKIYDLKILYKSENEDLAVLKIIIQEKPPLNPLLSKEGKEVENFRGGLNFKKVDFIKKSEKIENNDLIFSLNSDKKIFIWKILNKNSKIKFEKISKKNINFLLQKEIKNLIETNLETNFWDSGSPLFNNKNEVIWINTIRQNNKNYSIILDENKIKNILRKVWKIKIK